MNKIFTNWQTTSAGSIMALTAIIHLAFACKAGIATEGVWCTAVVEIIGGIGLIAAGDGNKSVSQNELAEVSQAVATAVETGDTSIILKTDAVARALAGRPLTVKNLPKPKP